jgi:outer membrane biosynthesis protein TonB
MNSTATLGSKNKSRVISSLLFLLFLLLLVIPIFSYQIPPPEQEGVLVSFGMPNKGQGNDRPKVQNEDPDQNETKEAQEKKVEEKKQPVKTEKKAAPPKKKEPTKIVTDKKEKEVVIQKKQVTKPDPKPPEPKIDLEAERIAREKAAQEAAAKAEAEKQAKYESAKKQFGDFLSGSGKGKTGTPGNQGDPGGDPDASKLTGISKGSGRVGGGLSNRGLEFEPEVKDNTQKTGKIVMNVCVDRTGKVISAEFTQRGSTNLDGELRKKAERACYKYKFSQAEIEEQCGTITFDFRVE